MNHTTKEDIFRLETLLDAGLRSVVVMERRHGDDKISR